MSVSPEVLDVAGMARHARRPMRLSRPLTFGRSGESDLRLLRLLREATSYAVRLDWTLAGKPRFPLHTYAHLVPPYGGVDEPASEYAREWRAAYRYAAFYYRRGPGFVTIKDVRVTGDASRILIEGDDAVRFLRMAETTLAEELPTTIRAMLTDAANAGLVLRVRDSHLALPYRMRNWPVPAVAG